MRFDLISAPGSLAKCSGRSGRIRGAVLFEVVVALVLFVAAATIITAGLNASMQSVERLRLNTHAADLAVSVLSELQMGTKTLALTGPQPFEIPFEGWTWEVVASPVESDATETSPLQAVEVIIRHEESGLIYRLSQMLRMEDVPTVNEAEMTSETLDF